MKKNTILTIATIAWFSLCLCGCAKFTSRGARIDKMPAGGSIAITVIKPDNKSSELTALEAYLTAALVGKGYSVRTLRLEMLASEMLLKRIFPDGSYSTSKALANGLQRGGEIEAEPEFVEKLLNRNEVIDGESRLEALARLTKKVPEAWGVDYILVVHQFDVYGFASYVVHLPDRKVINAFVISANKWGYRQWLGRPAVGNHVGAKDEPTDVSRMRYLRLAEYIAANL